MTADRVRGFLVDYARQREVTILLTTHNMDEAEEICDWLALISRGHLQFVGTPLAFCRSVTVQGTVEVTVSQDDPLVPQWGQSDGRTPVLCEKERTWPSGVWHNTRGWLS